jgi:hypothetical protein
VTKLVAGTSSSCRARPLRRLRICRCTNHADGGGPHRPGSATRGGSAG